MVGENDSKAGNWEREKAIYCPFPKLGIKAQLGKVAIKRDNEFTSPLKSSSE